jgi:Abortive infection C-terminus
VIFLPSVENLYGKSSLHFWNTLKQLKKSRPMKAYQFDYTVLTLMASMRSGQRRSSGEPQTRKGAITIARTLLETVCKQILEKMNVPFDEDKIELPDLYRMTAQALNLAPSQHTQDTFKKILGGVTSVVNELGSLRNRIGDAHGKGSRRVRPGIRHAELAVNLAGAIAVFLVQTWEARNN